MLDELGRILGYLRLNQLPRYVRRLVDRPATRPEDFLPSLDGAETQRLASLVRGIRGQDAPPAIFVHGVLPRSGTNFLADILALHPDVHPNPGRLWEFPLLYVAGGAEALQREFLFMFRENEQVLGPYDMLAFLAAGWMRKLQDEAGGRRILLKSPHVQNIGLFPAIFPDDRALLLLRDGRDVVASSMNTFAGRRLARKGFASLAGEWRQGCEAILAFEKGGPREHPGIHVVRYEDLMGDLEATVSAVLSSVGLDPSRYDFDALKRLPVRGSSTSATALDQRWQPHEKPASFNPVGRWKDWPEARKRRFLALAGPALQRAGYETEPRL